MDSSLIVFGRNVKYYRELRGLTQQELADLVGFTSRSTICGIENFARTTTMESAKKIAEALDIDIFTLLGRTSRLVDEFAPYLEKATEIQLEMVRLALGMPTKADKEKRDSVTNTNSMIKES